MDAKQTMAWLLGLDIVKGGGTYVMAAILILGGVIGGALGLVDPVTATGWLAMGYGLIRARVATGTVATKVETVGDKVDAVKATAKVEAVKVEALEEKAKP